MKYYVMRDSSDENKLVVMGALGHVPVGNLGLAPLDEDGKPERGEYLVVNGGKVELDSVKKEADLAQKEVAKLAAEAAHSARMDRLKGLNAQAVANANSIGELKGLIQLILERLDG